jgi:hypothetical protein
VKKDPNKEILIYIVNVLKNSELTKEEWILFGESLDGGYQEDFLELVNDHLVVIAPEIFADPKSET